MSENSDNRENPQESPDVESLKQQIDALNKNMQAVQRSLKRIEKRLAPAEIQAHLRNEVLRPLSFRVAIGAVVTLLAAGWTARSFVATPGDVGKVEEGVTRVGEKLDNTGQRLDKFYQLILEDRVREYSRGTPPSAKASATDETAAAEKPGGQAPAAPEPAVSGKTRD